MPSLSHLAADLTLGGVLDALIDQHGGYDLIAHWPQGEFHHDVVLRVQERGGLLADVLVIAVDCNGGVKEILCLPETPDRWALWHRRCPDNVEFEGELGPVLDQLRTCHWFDPCELLTPDARSEYRPDARRRARGGGWEPLER